MVGKAPPRTVKRAARFSLWSYFRRRVEAAPSNGRASARRALFSCLWRDRAGGWEWLAHRCERRADAGEADMRKRADDNVGPPGQLSARHLWNRRNFAHSDAPTRRARQRSWRRSILISATTARFEPETGRALK